MCVCGVAVVSMTKGRVYEDCVCMGTADTCRVCLHILLHSKPDHVNPCDVLTLCQKTFYSLQYYSILLFIALVHI